MIVVFLIKNSRTRRKKGVIKSKNAVLFATDSVLFDLMTFTNLNFLGLLVGFFVCFLLLYLFLLFFNLLPYFLKSIDFYAWLDFHLAQCIRIVERKRAEEVNVLVFLLDVSLSSCAVTLNRGIDVPHSQFLVVGFGNVGLNGADGQFAAILTAHLLGAGHGVVKLERGIGGNLADVWHI